MRNDQVKVTKADYHRNGISGLGFHIAFFDWKDPDRGKVRRMQAVVFEEAGACAVLDRDELAADNIEFARGNSWRGDNFEPALREQIKAIMDEKWQAFMTRTEATTTTCVK